MHKLKELINDIFKFIKINGLLIFFLKIIDKFFIPLGICFSSFFMVKKRQVFNSKKINLSQKNKSIFDQIYEKKYWQTNNLSVSGSGSNENLTRKYSYQLIQILNKFNINSIFDLPCGDFKWMIKILKQNKKINYIGGDISPSLIKNLKKKYKGYKFLNFDVIKSTNFPKSDLIHIRDCFIHFSDSDIKKSFINLKKNCKSKYIMISSHNSFILKNYDIKTGDFRILDLNKDPFNLSQSISKISDYKIGEFPKYVLLWKLRNLF
jgi:hypothetical protein